MDGFSDVGILAQKGKGCFSEDRAELTFKLRKYLVKKSGGFSFQAAAHINEIKAVPAQLPHGAGLDWIEAPLLLQASLYYAIFIDCVARQVNLIVPEHAGPALVELHLIEQAADGA